MDNTGAAISSEHYVLGKYLADIMKSSSSVVVEVKWISDGDKLLNVVYCMTQVNINEKQYMGDIDIPCPSL